MGKVSVLIPSYNERFMPETVSDIFNKATGEIEVIVCLDGDIPKIMPPDRSNLTFLNHNPARGMRAAINHAASVATGEYLMKCDAHCMFAEGFDEVLKADMEDNWIVIPRRRSLDPETWTIREKEPIDYHYLDCPMTNPEYFQFHGMVWVERRRQRIDILIDETMSFQGSMWFMTRKHWDWLGGMSEVGYGTFSQEPQEIGLKTQLGGGKLMTNKKTWYAHLHKGHQYGRMYPVSMSAVRKGHVYSAEYWMSNSWPERVHDIEWLIKHFWPVPRWPDNWLDLLKSWRENRELNAGTLRPEVQP